MSKISRRILKKKGPVRSYSDVPKPRRNEVIIGTQHDYLLDHMPVLGNALKRGRPDWWVDLPSHKGSFRRCYGINDLLAHGWQVDAWCDFHIHVNDPDHQGPAIHSPSKVFQATQFDFEQVGECPISEHNSERMPFPKVISPFYVRTPKHWSVLVIPSPFNYDPKYRVMPGVVHTDFFHDLHCAISVQATSSFTIERGTPLFYVFPFRRDFKLTKTVPAHREVQAMMEMTQFAETKFSTFPDSRRPFYKNAQRLADSEPRSLIDRLFHRR